MKFLLNLFIAFSSLSLHAQTHTAPQPLPDFDSIDLSAELEQMFNMVDSIPSNFGDFENIDNLFQQLFGEVSEDKELYSDLLNQGIKMMENLDLNEMQGLMDNFMKDFEELNMKELLDIEEIDKIEQKQAKRKKI